MVKILQIFFLILVTLFIGCNFEPSDEWKQQQKILAEKRKIKKELNKARKAEILSYGSLIDSSYTIPNNYYDYFGQFDFYRRPLVYPYSLISIDSRNRARICDERNNKNVEYDFNEKGEQLQHPSIGWLHFNEKALIAKSDSYDKTKPKYLLFNFKTKGFQFFDSIYDLNIAATNYDIDTTKKLISVEEYHKIFW